MFDLAPSSLAWVTVHHPGQPRRHELDLGKHGTVVLLELTSGVWRCGWQDAKATPGSKRVLADRVPIERAQDVGETYALEHGAGQLVAADARWRTERPTAKQLERCAACSIEVPVGADKGTVSDLLGAYFARKRKRKNPTA